MTAARTRLVAIDARGYFTGGGVGRYTRNLVRELADGLLPGIALRLLISSRHAPADLDLPRDADIDVLVSRAGWFDAEDEDRWLEGEVADADLFHSLTGHWLPRAGASVATLHDLTPLVRPNIVTEEARRVGQSIARAIGRASHLITVSHSTARDARRLLQRGGPPITVVPEAAAPVFRTHEPSREILDRYGLARDGFVLAVSALNPHKNISGLIRAYAASEVAAPLVVVGAHRDAIDDVCRVVAECRLDSGVRLLERVPDDHLAALYAACRLFVYPSLYEGFGLPVLEAMACGAPVIASSTSSIPEVAGDAAILVDTSQTRALARAIRRVDWDGALRTELRRRSLVRARAFSWSRTAAETLTVYAGMLQTSRSDVGAAANGSDPRWHAA